MPGTVALLLPLSGENNSTVFTDISPSPKTVSVFGDAKIQTAVSKFYGSSAFFDGTGDFASVPYSTDFEFGAGDFTIACWVRFNSFAGNGWFQQFFGSLAASGTYYAVDLDYYAGDIRFELTYNTTTITLSTASAVSITTGVWYHVAATREGNVFRLFVDGILRASTTNTISIPTNTSKTIGIGGLASGATYKLNGYLQDAIIVKESALYTADFPLPDMLDVPEGYIACAYSTLAAYAPETLASVYLPYTTNTHTAYAPIALLTPIEAPTASYIFSSIKPKVAPGGTYLGNVVLAVPFSGTNGSTQIDDFSDTPKLFTAFGDTHIQTAVSKYYGSSVVFDRAGDYAKSAASVDFHVGSEAFELSVWVYNTSTLYGDYDQHIFQVHSPALGEYFGLLLKTYGGSSTTADFRFNLYSAAAGKSIDLQSYVSFPYLNWYHVAVTRQGNTYKLYVNGVLRATTTSTYTSYLFSPDRVAYIGSRFNSSSFFAGYMQDLTWNIGYVEHTTDFTPPDRLIPPPPAVLTFTGLQAAGLPTALIKQSVALVTGQPGAGLPTAEVLVPFTSIVRGTGAIGLPQIQAAVVIQRTASENFTLSSPVNYGFMRTLFAQFTALTVANGQSIFQAVDLLTASDTDLLMGVNTTVRLYMQLSAVQRVLTELADTLKQTITQSDTVSAVFPLFVQSVLTLTDSSGLTLDRILKLNEQLRVAVQTRATGELLLRGYAGFGTTDTLSTNTLVGLTELLTLTSSMLEEFYYGAVAIEQVLVADNSIRAGEFSKVVREFLTFAEVTGFISQLRAVDTVTGTAAVTPSYVRELIAQDQLSVSAVETILLELAQTLMEIWNGSDQVILAQLLSLQEQLVVEAALLTGARGYLTERLGLVEQARATLELTSFLQEALSAREATAFITALGLADTLTLQDQAVLDAVARLLAREPLALVALVGAVQETGIRLSELIGVNSLTQFRAGFALLDELALTDTALLDLLKDWLLRENLGITTTTTPLVELAIRLAETVRLLERDAPVLWSKLSTGFSLEEASRFSLQYVLNVREQLVLTGAAPVVVELLTGLVELASFVDYTGTVEFLTASDQLSLQALLYNGLAARLSEQFDLTELGNAAGFFGLSLSTGLAVQDASQSWVELLAQAKTGLMFFGRMPLHEGDFTAWVFNTDNLGLTQYTNYNFNSFMECKGKMYGVREDGLYLLEGTTDTGTAIDTLMATGDLHFGTHIRKAIPRAYLYVTKPGDLVLRTISYHYGQAQEHFYEITLRPEDTVGVHRLRLRREIRAEAWAFEIKNVDGGEFELQGAEILPVLLTRRN